MKGGISIIIFTNDETPFRSDNEIIMYGTIDSIPTLKETTYILHTNKFSSNDVITWSPLVQNKLVIITEKLPKLSKKAKELCVIDDNLKKKDNNETFMLVRGMLNWEDRNRVKALYREQPTALLLWFLKSNIDDIKMWRRVAKVLYFLPEKYLKASLIYGIKPSRKRVVWPKKKKTVKEKPELFRETDKHWEILLENSITVANEVRDNGDVPKGMRKTKERQHTWI